MMKRLRASWRLFLLAASLLPVVVLAHNPSFTRGNPCHAESTLYYSDASLTTRWRQRIHLLAGA
jgi:hypothetical protein